MTSVSRPSRAHISCRYGTVLTQPLPLTAQRGGSTQGQGNTFADRWKDALARLVSPAFCDHPPSSVPTSSWQILTEWHNCSSKPAEQKTRLVPSQSKRSSNNCLQAQIKHSFFFHKLPQLSTPSAICGIPARSFGGHNQWCSQDCSYALQCPWEMINTPFPSQLKGKTEKHKMASSNIYFQIYSSPSPKRPC